MSNYTADPGGGYPIGAGFFIVNIQGKFYLYQSAIPGSHTALDADMRFPRPRSAAPRCDNNGCGLLDAEGATRVVFYPGPFSLDPSSRGALLLPGRQPLLPRRRRRPRRSRHVGGFNAGPISLSANIDGQAFSTSRTSPASSSTHRTPHRSTSAARSAPNRSRFDRLDLRPRRRLLRSVNTGSHTFDLGVGESFIPPPVNQFIFLKNLSFMWDGCDLSHTGPSRQADPPPALRTTARSKSATHPCAGATRRRWSRYRATAGPQASRSTGPAAGRSIPPPTSSTEPS